MISDKFGDHCKEVAYDILLDKGIVRSLINVVKKSVMEIREAQLQKIPYMLVLGEKEVNDVQEYFRSFQR